MYENAIQDIIPPKRVFDRPRKKAAEGIRQGRRRSERRKISVRLKAIKAPRRKYILVGTAAIVLVLILFLTSSIFSSVTISIVPRSQEVDINTKVTATLNNGNGLTFDVMSMADASESVLLSSTETKDVARKASGKIIIFNNYSSQSQKLIERTRFETPDGKIYRIREGIVVPGTGVQNGNKIPGSVEVTVYADEAGSDYNIGLTDFTIPGFKGDPRFDFFFARSKTAMTGGFVGELKVVSPEAKEQASSLARNTLRTSLIDTASQELPDEFIFFDGTLFISYDEKENQSPRGEDDKVELVETARFSAAIFDKNEFAYEVARQIIPEVERGVMLLGIKQLDVRILDKEEIDIHNADSLTLSVTGNVVVVWPIDEESLKRDLGGVGKGSFEEIFARYPNIKQAEVIFRPSWSRSFPEDSKKINIETSIK